MVLLYSEKPVRTLAPPRWTSGRLSTPVSDIEQLGGTRSRSGAGCGNRPQESAAEARIEVLKGPGEGGEIESGDRVSTVVLDGCQRGVGFFGPCGGSGDEAQ